MHPLVLTPKRDVKALIIYLYSSSIARNVREDQRRTKYYIYQNPGKNRGVRNKDNATLDVSMAKQKRKRDALALSTIVKLSSTKLLRRIPHPPRVKRRTHHRPGRRCCVTQSEGQVSKYSVLGTGLPPEKVRSPRFSLVACHFISGLSAPKFGAIMEYESRFPETRDSCQYNIL